MSELQTSLLIIGVVIVIAVYGYNLWQQRQYRRRLGAAFQPHKEDALYRVAAEKPAPEKTLDELLAESAVDELGGGVERDPPAAPSHGEPSRAQGGDSACASLDAAIDYIAVLSLKSPGSAHALAPLWRQRFDFGKNVHICGLNAASGAWEKVVAESLLSYSAFKLALQLADRSGAVSGTRLMDFRDLARDIAAQMRAEAELPDVAAAGARASELDNFCAGVDVMIGLNILPGGERKFSGNEVADAAEAHGMSLQADGTFHFPDLNGHTLYSLGNFDNVPFQHHTLGQMWVGGLTLLLDVPRVEQPAQRFDGMAVLARQLAMGLRATLTDDHRVALGEPGLALIREQVADIEKRMLSGNITPGSVQARRLFS